jgi:hypothetical protein
MNGRWGLSLLAVAAAGCVQPDIVPDVKRRMVEIVMLDETGKPTPSCGVGLIIGPDTVLTAAHVVTELQAHQLPDVKLNWTAGSIVANGTQYQIRLAEDGTDVALLKLVNQNFNVKPDDFDAFGVMTEDDVVAYPQGFVASYHSATCKGAYETAPNYATPMAVQLSGPVDRGTASMIRTGSDLGPGYSGGALVSRQLGVVVGVYVEGDTRHGFAARLDNAKSLLEPRALHRHQVLPDLVDLSLAEAVAPSQDSLVDFDALKPAFSALFRLPRFTRRAFWLTAGIQLDYASWLRQRVVQGYPGANVTVVDDVSGKSLGVAPVVGGRLELQHLVFKLDMPFPLVFVGGGEHDSLAVAWAPQASVGLRVHPWTTELRSSTAVTPTLSLFYSTPLHSASVMEYTFNPLGERGQVERDLELPHYGVRLGMEIGL